METVKEHPNDMELGGIIRSMFWDKRDISNDKQLDLFESIDNKNRAKIIKEIRGRGLLIGIQLHKNQTKFIKELIEPVADIIDIFKSLALNFFSSI